MKKIIIGRSPDCHVRIKDDTDKISRRQAVIEVSPFGKMIIHDTSSNGTFVNGKPVEKPNGTPVTREDVVDLAHVTNLDWSLIRDPYRGMKIAVGIFCLVLVAVGVLYFIYGDTILGRSVKEQPDSIVVVDSADEDTAMAEDSIATPAKTASEKTASKQKAAPNANRGAKKPGGKDSISDKSQKKEPMLPDMRKPEDKMHKPNDEQGLTPKTSRPQQGQSSMMQEKNK